MPKVRIIRSLGRDYGNKYKENEIVDVTDAEAKQLFEANLAEPIKAVPKSVSIKAEPPKAPAIGGLSPKPVTQTKDK